MQFTLTIELPDVDRPGVPVANRLRAVADRVETQTPLEDTGHLLDPYGMELCRWTVAEPVEP